MPRMKRTRWHRVGLTLLVACGLALTATSQGAAAESIERFLPESTFLYGGVEKLGSAFDKVTAVIQSHFPVPREMNVAEAVLHELADDVFDLDDVRTRDQFLAQTGLDPDGSAGIAWVLSDPSYPFHRSINENVLLILPVKDAARFEALLAKVMLGECLRESRSICRRQLRRIEEAKKKLAKPTVAMAPGPVTWAALGDANPGLKELRCPGGGEYKLGGPGQKPACSVHAQDGDPRHEGPLTRDGLGTRQMGDVTLVGGRAKGTGYAITATHLVLSNNMNVLEAAVAAATGAGPRAKLAPPTAGPASGEGRGLGRMKFLLDVGIREIVSELRRDDERRTRAPARRLIGLLKAGADLTVDASLKTDPAGKPVLDVAATWDVERNLATGEFLDTPPAELAAFALVPDTASFAVGTNLARHVSTVVGDIASAFDEDGEVNAPLKLVRAAVDGDGAFAMTQGVFADEMPNMLLILRIRDQETAQAVVEAWETLVSKELRAKGVETTQVGGVTLRTLEGRGKVALHYALSGKFFIGGTKKDDVVAVINAQAAQGGNALIASEKFRKLGHQPGPANAVMFLDVPALVNEIGAAEYERRIRYANERCRRELKRIEDLASEFRKEHDRWPTDLDDLRRGLKKRPYVPKFCWVRGGLRLKYSLDPATGKASCERIGTLEDFKPLTPQKPRPRDEEEVIVSAFGTSVLRARLEGGKIKAEGRLIPVRQRRVERGGF